MLLFSICSNSINLCFILKDGETFTPPSFVYMPDCLLSCLFSTPVTWDLHINFFSQNEIWNDITEEGCT